MSCLSHRYIEEFVRLTCASDLLALKLFPNAKEITESMAAYTAVRTFVGFSFSDPEVTLIAVGDGFAPRTAAMFAFRSFWKCFSVDPNLRNKAAWHRIDRLTMMPSRIENVSIEATKAAIVAVHSHAKLPDALKAVTGAKQISVVTIPCCVPQELDTAPDVLYEDIGIWSPERTVKIWEKV